jgi:hypothetical protein
MKRTRISKDATIKRKIELKQRLIRRLGHDRRGIFAQDLDHVLSKLSEADLYVLVVAVHEGKQANG